jgi:predicted naringenin-chalcone synthase
LTSLFPEENPALIRQLVERSGVEERYLAPTPEQVLDRKSFTDRNLAYASTAVELAARACRTALDRAQFRARDVEALIDVSCTGLCIPALDVPLASRLGLRPDVRDSNARSHGWTLAVWDSTWMPPTRKERLADRRLTPTPVLMDGSLHPPAPARPAGS